MIRRAEPRDLEVVNKLLRQVLQVHHAGRPDLFRAEGKKYSDEELLSIFACDDTPVFVYEEEDGKVTGYVFCVFKWQESGCLTPRLSLYIDDLCVDEQARRRKVGTKLFAFVQRFAREKGCHNIVLHVWECNPGAIAFYRSLGMTPQFTSMELLCNN